MTNRGTARRMNVRRQVKDEDEPKKVTLTENTANHRKRHPNDILSFSQGKIEDDFSGLLSDIEEKNTPYMPKKKGLKPKRKKQMLALIEVDDQDELALFSRRELQLLGLEWLAMFRRNNEIESPDMPLDSSAEVIDYPAGRGRGKIAIAEWLCKYESHYKMIREKAEMDESIRQTLLG